MCLILFSYKQHPGYRLVLAANRDEFLDRPTLPLDYNFAEESILAGRDLRGGGTWLALGGDGRLAAITNYRDPARIRDSAPSRGQILLDYLRSKRSAFDFLSDFNTPAGEYNGFNLLLLDQHDMLHFSNVTGVTTRLAPGLYGLSNHLLNSPWPKVERGRRMLADTLLADGQPNSEEIFRLLQDNQFPDDSQLPQTGVGLEWERLLSPIFIQSPGYGTRSSALVTINDAGTAAFHERTYVHTSDVRKTEDRSFSITLDTVEEKRGGAQYYQSDLK
jgi:uncharacterized protein with NRDE domain